MAGRTTTLSINYSLYLILDSRFARGRALLDVAQAAVRGGVTVLQIREKHLTTRELVRAALELRAWAREAGVPFIINDRVDVALAVDADGVHLGPDDMALETARRILGHTRIIGVSAGTQDEAREAARGGADYIGVGAVYNTASKSDAGAPIGVDGFAAIARSVRIPAVAIGGLSVDNVAPVIMAGAAGVAVISAIVGAMDVERAANEMRSRIDAARHVATGSR
ncbi:MAG: thiamine phosphate synthase [Chloroflexi bacterium]|nr:thiamine phosphate synthase [Chloroflexota bacterium]MCL5274506.1 thiamine phosphate synthase [Chloroflexota bacterium]